MTTQNQLMKFDPATGLEKPYPSHAEQWRNYHGNVAWLFNPWTGQLRSASDVGSDCYGRAIQPPGSILVATPRARVEPATARELQELWDTVSTEDKQLLPTREIFYLGVRAAEVFIAAQNDPEVSGDLPHHPV